MRSRWYHPPIFHSALSRYEKKASWLELFFDLIFVAAFIQIGNVLSEDISAFSFAKFTVSFLCLWIIWSGFTFYANRYEIDDFVHRILSFFLMLVVGAMGIYASEIVEAGRSGFAIFYGCGTLIVALMYLRSYLQQHRGKEIAKYWGSIFGFSSLFAFLAAASPFYLFLGFATLSLGVILISPFTKLSRQQVTDIPYDHEHLAERYGILTIIVLGESFVKVVLSLAADQGAGIPLGQASFSLLITFSIWWIYFDDVAGTHLKKQKLAQTMWLYGHLPFQLAVVVLGVGVKKAIYFDLAEVAPEKYRWLLCGALALAFFSVAMIDSVTERKQSELSDRLRVNMRLASGILMTLLVFVGSSMSAQALLVIVMVMCLAQVLFDMMMAPFEQGTPEHQDYSSIASKIDRGEKLVTSRERLTAPIKKGLPNELRSDIYFYLMDGSWTRVFVFLGFVYFISNVFFAALYMLEPGAVQNVSGSSFWEAFYFSVQTMSTIGYGFMSPVTSYGNTVVTVEAAFGLIGVALATGFMFAKASQPKKGIMFSKQCVLIDRNGKPTMQFRVGNAKGNEIIDATMSLSILLDEVSTEGHHLRRLHDLKLSRNRSPVFSMSWSIIHEIDESSPLKGIDITAEDSPFLGLIAVIMGHDGTYGQTVYERHIYSKESFVKGYIFEDILMERSDGRFVVDYSKFHDVKKV